MIATMTCRSAASAGEKFWPTVLLTINAAPVQRAVVERAVAKALKRADPANRLRSER